MPVGSTRKRRMFVYLGVVLVGAVVCLIVCRVRNDGLPADQTAMESKINPANDVGKPAAAPDSVRAMARNDTMELKPIGNEVQPVKPMTKSSVDAFLHGDGINYDIQSPARPFGLDVVSPVHMAGSDAASSNFMANTLPDILDYLKSNAVNQTSLDLVSTEANPDNLILDNPSSVRIYFVGDAAGYHNSIGINYAGDAGPMLVFPDASSANSAERGGNVRQEYTSADYQLLPGDFVDLGSAEAGSVLDLSLFRMAPIKGRMPTALTRRSTRI